MKLTVSTCLVALLAGCGSSDPPRPSLEDDLAAIAAFNARYLRAINDEDIAALSALTTQGHIMLAPNRAPIVGKAANDELNGNAFEQSISTRRGRPKKPWSQAIGRISAGRSLCARRRKQAATCAMSAAASCASTSGSRTASGA